MVTEDLRCDELRSPRYVPLEQPLQDQLSVDRAIEVLYARHYGAIRSIVHRRVQNIADADDITQTVFVKLATSFHIVHDKDVGKWLSRVAVNAAIDAVRRKHLVWLPLSEGHPCEASAESTFLRETELTRVRFAIDGLPAREKLVVELSYLEGYTHKQIAGRVGLPLGTVKTLIRRGRKRLRAVLEGEETAQTL